MKRVLIWVAIALVGVMAMVGNATAYCGSGRTGEHHVRRVHGGCNPRP